MVLWSSLSLHVLFLPSSSSSLPLLRGAERLALQQQRKDGMSTGFREKWVQGDTQMGIECSVPVPRQLKFKTCQRTTSRRSDALQHLWHVHVLKCSKAGDQNRLKHEYLKIINRCFFSCFFFRLEQENGATNTTKEMRMQSVGSAKWKTSDFVVTLIKEQQVPVCLSAQAVLFSLHQLLAAWLFSSQSVHVSVCETLSASQSKQVIIPRSCEKV